MDSDILSARISDGVMSAVSGSEKYIGFLSESDASKAVVMARNANVKCVLFGGYDGADRVFAAFIPDYLSEKDIEFPICPITFRYRTCDSLSHRDFLGALMGIGIERDTVGDILIEQGRAVVFVAKSVENYVLTQITKVGRVGVAVESGYSSYLPQKNGFQELRFTAASDRADAVIAGLCKTSRSDSASLIADHMVFVDSVELVKPTAKIKAGSVVSVRGKGKFVIQDLLGTTKKGRIIINAKKYI